VKRHERSRRIDRSSETAVLKDCSQLRVRREPGSSPHLEEQDRHGVEIGLTLSRRDRPPRCEAGIAQPDAAVGVNKHVARVDRAMDETSTVECPQPPENAFRKCRDLSRRQRSDRGEPAQAQPRIEGANQHHRVAVDGDSHDVDERIVAAPSDPSKASRQLPLRFWTHAQHPLRDADVSCPYPHEPCIAVTAAAEPPQPLHLLDVDLVRGAARGCHRKPRNDSEFRFERILIAGRTAR
jgi:hypothetical protein